MSIYNWLIEMFYILKHFSESCFDKIENPFYENNKSMFYIFFIFWEDKIMKQYIVYIKNFFYYTEHNPQDNSIYFHFMTSNICCFYHIHETVFERSPIFEEEVFFSKKHFFNKNTVIIMERTAIDHCYNIINFSVDDVFIYDKFEKIILKCVIRSSFLCWNHTSMLTEFDLFCKSLAWCHDFRRPTT